MADRAREAYKALGDAFLASPRIALASICDYCPDYVDHVEAIASFLRSPGAPAFLGALANGSIGRDPQDSESIQWCKSVLAYACGLSDSVPAFASEARSHSPSSAIVAPAQTPGLNWAAIATGVAIVCVTALILFNRGKQTPTTPPASPPVTAHPIAPAPADTTPAFPAPPLDDYRPPTNSGSAAASVARAHRRKPEGASRDGAHEDRPATRPSMEHTTPKPAELHHKDTPPPEGDE